jgi:hypothetical protein
MKLLIVAALMYPFLTALVAHLISELLWHFSDNQKAGDFYLAGILILALYGILYLIFGE